MSVRSAPARSTTRARPARPRGRRKPSRRTVVRRWALLLGAIAAGVVAVFLATAPFVDKAVHEVTLPLRHEDIIRQQAREKGLDPALIAGVIYTESHFRHGQTSSAGALGLMQLTPATARYIAHKSGGTQFVVDDLATPQVNIAYGTYYLRYLLRRYDGNEDFALAAYNAGEGNVDKWIAAARERDRALTIDAIPYAETRAYVSRVESAKREYRRNYGAQLLGR